MPMVRWLDRAVETMLALLLLALIATVFAQVIARYVFAQPFSWVLELDVLLLVWLTMLSGYVGVRRGTHIASDFALRSASSVTRHRFAIAVQLLCAMFVALAGWKSLENIDAMKGMPLASLPLEQPVIYWSLPVGMGLMVVATVLELRHLVRRPTS